MAVMDMENSVVKCPEATSSQSQAKSKARKPKKDKKLQTHQANVPKTTPKVERPLYENLGEQLLASTQPQPPVKPTIYLDVAKTSPPHTSSQPPPSPLLLTPVSEMNNSFFELSDSVYRSISAISLNLGRNSEESTLSGSTRTSRDDYRPFTVNGFKGSSFTLDNHSAMKQAEPLITRYGQVAHMGVRDPSYRFWMNRTRSAVVHFKLVDKVAVLGGDPLCHPDRFNLTIHEFGAYCKENGWKLAVIGASNTMAGVASARGWTTMRFGTETVLNPQTNEVLLGKSGKRTVTQCKQLLDSNKGGISVHTYSPALGRDREIETDLTKIYDDWRNARNTARESQAFITVFDMFSMNSLMTFLYTKDREGRINGFAALRKLGANNGYHIDPFIQTVDAPRGTSDLLIYSSLAFLRAAGISYLSLGFEPLATVGEISGLPSALHSTTRKIYKHVFGKIPVGGKEAFHARWKPDTAQETPVYLVFVGRIPSPRFMVAMMHYANISLRAIVKQDWEGLRRSNSKKDKAHGDAANDTSSSGEEGTLSPHQGKASKVVSQGKQKPNGKIIPALKITTSDVQS